MGAGAGRVWARLAPQTRPVRNRENAASVMSETWCSMPSASCSAASSGTPTATSRSTTSRCRSRTRCARRLAGFRQEYAAIGAGGRQPLALQPRNRLDRGGMRDAEAARDVGRPCLTAGGEQVGDQLGIILQQRGGLRGAGLAEAARLRRFLRQLDRHGLGHRSGLLHHDGAYQRHAGIATCRCEQVTRRRHAAGRRGLRAGAVPRLAQPSRSSLAASGAK